VSFTFQKEGVFESLYIGLAALVLMEIVHVQLSNKAGEVIVFEELGQDFVTKQILILDLETIVIFSPRNYVICARTINNFIKFNEECWNVV
jgi:hypothetical protein